MPRDIEVFPDAPDNVSSSGEELNATYIPVLEKVLDVSLKPPGIENIPLTKNTIRGHIGSTVVGHIRDRYEQKVTPEGIDLTDDQIEELRQLTSVRRLGAELQAANDTLVNWHRPPEMPVDADGNNISRAIAQAEALKHLVDHAQQAPLRVRDPQSPYAEGMLTVAPPGFGKTVLQALAANYAGIGQPVSRNDSRRRTALGILRSRQLIEQYLDPDETMQRFINIGGRRVRIGAYYTERHDGHDEYDLLLTTPESYVPAMEAGAINTDTTIRYFLDEAHRTALEPRMQKHITGFGPGLYLFTATPAIARGRRDLRRQFPHSQYGSLREYAQDGILSPFQLFTYRAGPEANSEAHIAMGLAADLVSSGRKTLIVCQRGEEMKQAHDIADWLNRLYQDGKLEVHPRFERADKEKIACAIGHNLPTRQNLELLRRGERLIVTTVATGNEGMDIPDLEGIILIDQGAPWMVDQWLGRVARPSGRSAIAAEIFPHILRESRPRASIFASFGIYDEIVPGYYIGPPLPREGQSYWGGAVALRVASSESIDDSASQVLQTIPNFYKPPEELGTLLVKNTSVREATIAPADLLKLPPEDYKPLNIELPEGVPETWLYTVLSRLDDPDIRYVGSWEQDEDGRLQYVRYYSPAAHQYFKDNPVPELAEKAQFSQREIASVLQVSRGDVREAMRELGIKPLPPVYGYTLRGSFGMESLKRITAEIEKIPRATETDVAVGDLVVELGSGFIETKLAQYNIAAANKRRHPIWGRVGTCLHVTEADATFLHSIYTPPEMADPRRHMNYEDIAKLSGTSVYYVSQRFQAIPPDSMPRTYWLRKTPKKSADYVDRTWGEAFAEYLKPEKLLPWEVTTDMIIEYFRMTMSNVRAQGVKRGVTKAKILLPGGLEKVVYPLSFMIDLIGYTKPAKDAPIIIPEQAALSPDDVHNQKKIAYSQKLQRHFLPSHHIAAPEEIAYYLERRNHPPKLPDRALSPSAPNRQSISINSSSPKVVNKGSNKNSSKKQNPSVDIPEDFINLTAYLSEQNTPCAQYLLLTLAQRNKITRQQLIQSPYGTYWAAKNNAETIAASILEFPTASHTMVSDISLARQFSDKWHTVPREDIHKVAGKLLQGSSVEIDMVRRKLKVRLPDDSPGELCFHYTQVFAARIEEVLQSLQEKGQLRMIRRW